MANYQQNSASPDRRAFIFGSQTSITGVSRPTSTGPEQLALQESNIAGLQYVVTPEGIQIPYQDSRRLRSMYDDKGHIMCTVDRNVSQPAPSPPPPPPPPLPPSLPLSPPVQQVLPPVNNTFVTNSYSTVSNYGQTQHFVTSTPIQRGVTNFPVSFSTTTNDCNVTYAYLQQLIGASPEWQNGGAEPMAVDFQQEQQPVIRPEFNICNPPSPCLGFRRRSSASIINSILSNKTDKAAEDKNCFKCTCYDGSPSHQSDRKQVSKFQSNPTPNKEDKCTSTNPEQFQTQDKDKTKDEKTPLDNESAAKEILCAIIESMKCDCVDSDKCICEDSDKCICEDSDKCICEKCICEDSDSEEEKKPKGKDNKESNKKCEEKEQACPDTNKEDKCTSTNPEEFQTQDKDKTKGTEKTNEVPIKVRHVRFEDRVVYSMDQERDDPLPVISPLLYEELRKRKCQDLEILHRKLCALSTGDKDATQISVPIAPCPCICDSPNSSVKQPEKNNEVHKVEITPCCCVKCDPPVPPCRPTINFTQLNDYLRRWFLELPDHEALFLNQASEITKRDLQLLASQEKLCSINQMLQQCFDKMKNIQIEGEAVMNLQKELENHVKSLDRSYPPMMNVYDHQRAHIYNMTEFTYFQMRKLSETYQEIMEALETQNTQLKKQSVQQLTNVLDHHTNVLRTIDQKITQLANELRALIGLQQSIFGSPMRFL